MAYYVLGTVGPDGSYIEDLKFTAILRFIGVRC